MKKLLLSLGAIAFAMNATATSTLDQAKLNTVAKVYQTGNLYKYANPVVITRSSPCKVLDSISFK